MSSSSEHATGLAYRRPPMAGAVLDAKQLPETFPMTVWTSQIQRYNRCWNWFNGTELDATRKTAKGSVKKYPLRINPIANFAAKHAAILLGEEASDTPLPLARNSITPKRPLMGEESYSEADKELARTAKNVLDEVWASSDGRAIQMENAYFSQFLGGSVFQVNYHHPRSEEAQRLLIPVTITNVIPDFFVPLYDGRDYWNLTEAYLVYRIPAYIAQQTYGEEYVSSREGWATYCQHWTRNSYSILLNGIPLRETVAGVTITYDNLPNPWGFVPFVYIPHIRVGDFYGTTHVDDLEGLTRELNGRLSDVGDSIRDTVHRRRYIKDSTMAAKEQDLAPGTRAINVGSTNPTTKASPDVWTEDAPDLSDGLINYANDTLWAQLLREGSLSNIAFGEDDVSQRSAIALAMRMFPTTSHSRAERTYWTSGLNLIAKMVLRICAIKAKEIKSVKIDADFERRLMFAIDWLPQIPRDREQQVNEVILRVQSGLMSKRRALTVLADSDYIDEELKLIEADQLFAAHLATIGSPSNGSAGGEGADTKMTTPVVTDGMED